MFWCKRYTSGKVCSSCRWQNGRRKAGPPIRYQEINAVITDDKNRNLLPPKEFLSSYHAAGKWHKIPGYNSMSPILELIDVSAGQELRLWYVTTGEDPALTFLSCTFEM